LIFGITISWWLGEAFCSEAHCSAIHSAVGTAQLRNRRWRLPHGVAVKSIDRPVTEFVAAAHNGQIRNFIFFEQFQFALPPDWNAIILPRKVGIGPVGVRPFHKRESPP
jgi:hypothetical protein